MTSTAPFAHHSEILSMRCGRVPAIQRSRKPKFFIARAAAPTLPASCGAAKMIGCEFSVGFIGSDKLVAEILQREERFFAPCAVECGEDLAHAIPHRAGVGVLRALACGAGAERRFHRIRDEIADDRLTLWKHLLVETRHDALAVDVVRFENVADLVAKLVVLRAGPLKVKSLAAEF